MRCTVFEIFDFKNALTLQTALRVSEGHLKCHHSIESLVVTSYGCSIATMALSRVVSELMNDEMLNVEIPVKGQSRSLKVHHSIYWVWFPISVL